MTELVTAHHPRAIRLRPRASSGRLIETSHATRAVALRLLRLLPALAGPGRLRHGATRQPLIERLKASLVPTSQAMPIHVESRLDRSVPDVMLDNEEVPAGINQVSHV